MMLLGKKVSVTDAEGRDCTWTVVSQRIDGHVQVATSSLAISEVWVQRSGLNNGKLMYAHVSKIRKCPNLKEN